MHGPGHISLVEILSWNNFCSHSLSIAASSRAVVNYWQKYGPLGILPAGSDYWLMTLMCRLACKTTKQTNKWAPSSEFVSSSIPSWQILTAHAQPFRGARDLAFCLKVPLDSLLVWASSGGSGKTVRMRRLAWTFAARIGDKYQIRLMRPK